MHVDELYHAESHRCDTPPPSPARTLFISAQLARGLKTFLTAEVATIQSA